MISQQAESFSISCFLKFLRRFFGKAAEFRAARGRGETLAGGFSCGLCTVFVAFSRKSDAKSFHTRTKKYISPDHIEYQKFLDILTLRAVVCRELFYLRMSDSAVRAGGRSSLLF